MTRTNENRVGVAYCFFSYGHERSIERSLSYLRVGAEIPSETILEVIVGVHNVDTTKDPALVEVVEWALEQKRSHVLKASLPESGNRRTANIVGDLMNAIYQDLFYSGESLYSTVAYKRGERYVVKRR